MIKVAIIEDDHEIREHMTLIINNTDGFNCVHSFHKVEEAALPLLADPPDVLLLDISLSEGMNGIEGISYLRSKGAPFEIIMLTVHQDDQKVFDSLCAGACGYLTKNTPIDKILVAVREAHNGGAPMSTKIARMVINSFKRNSDPELSAREKEVLAELCKGKSYKMVAESLFISQDTVRTHIRSIYRKLEVNSKSEAVAKALRDRLV